MFDLKSLPPYFHYRAPHSMFQDLHVYCMGFCDFSRFNNFQEVSMAPFVHPHHTIHFILEGEGTYVVNNTVKTLKACQAFYTPPATALVYKPNEEKPWTYVWFAFIGNKSDEYVEQFPFAQTKIIDSPRGGELRKIIIDFLSKNPPGTVREELLRSLFFNAMEKLTQEETIAEPQDSQQFYISLAKEFIQLNFSNPNLSIQNIAQSIHISHSYLCGIFKSQEKYSVKSYLTKVRLNHAASLLSNREKTITEISLACGYKDPLYFSAAFKKHFGVSPTLFRERYHGFKEDNGLMPNIDENN